MLQQPHPSRRILKVKPLSHYRQPRYPTHLQVLDTPDLLQKHLPRSWQTCAELTGALAICLSTAGLAHAQEAPPSGISNTTTAQPGTTPAQAVGEGKSQPAERKHKCMMVTVGVVDDATSANSEESTLDVIKDSLYKSKIGIRRDRRPPKQPSNEIVIWSEIDGKPSTKRVIPGDPALQTDGFDSKKKIGVAVVFDMDEFLAHLRSNPTEAQQKTDPHTDNGAKQESSVYIGVFEDEMATADCENSGKLRRQERAKAKRLLRQQVQDFVSWLKAQGII